MLVAGSSCHLVRLLTFRFKACLDQDDSTFATVAVAYVPTDLIFREKSEENAVSPLTPKRSSVCSVLAKCTRPSSPL